MFNVLQRTLTDIRESVFTENGTQKTEQVSYTVRKLADGNVWMVDSLSLNWSSTREFTPADTNVKTSKSINITTQSLDGSDPAMDSMEAGAWRNANIDSWLSRSSNKQTDPAGRKYGTYYNWYTATMGSVSSNTTQSYPITSEEDICPTGWQLSHRSGFGSYLYLLREIYHYIASGETTGSTAVTETLFAFPFQLAKSGYISYASGMYFQRDSYGPLHSSIAIDSEHASTLDFNSTNLTVHPVAPGIKKAGFTIRCLAKF